MIILGYSFWTMPVEDRNIFKRYMKALEIDKGVHFALINGLLHTRLRCRKCLAIGCVNIIKNKQSPDGFSLKCSRCNHRMTLRTGSFFYDSKLSIEQILVIVGYFVSGLEVSCVAEHTLISNKTVIDWFEFCRNICEHALDLPNTKIGGPGLVVQIDDSLFLKRKNNRGRNLERSWYFGGYCQDQKNGFVVPVERRDSESLIPLIDMYVERGSIIHSGERSAFNCLSSYGWIHQTVNHSQHFVDPVTGVGTQEFESFWNQMKRKLRHFMCSQGDLQYDQVIEYMYRFNFGFNTRKSFEEKIWMFFEHIRAKYNGEPTV